MPGFWFAVAAAFAAALALAGLASPAHAVSVGFYGTYLHFDGTRWERWNSGTPWDLTGVWGWGGSVFLVGGAGTAQRLLRAVD